MKIFLTLIYSNLSILYIINSLCIFFRKSFPTLRSEIYSPKFSSKSFNVLFLTCKTLIHLEFIFIWDHLGIPFYFIWKIILFYSSN